MTTLTFPRAPGVREQIDRLDERIIQLIPRRIDLALALVAHGR